MGKSQRSSRIKTNNQALKKKVFGPVETARNERQNAKLLALAQQGKEEKMAEAAAAVDEKPEVSTSKENTNTEAAMDVDDATTKHTRSKREVKRLQAARAEKQLNKSRKRARNMVTFPKKRGSKK